MRKILAVLGVVFLVGCLFMPLVGAAYVCPAAQEDVTAVSDSSIYKEHPDSTAYGSAVGMAFTANATAYLYNVTWWMNRLGSITGSMTASLYAVAGTVGNNAYPTGAALATSEVVDMSVVGGSSSYITFNFYDNYTIQDGVSYVISCELTSVSGGSSSNAIRFPCKVVSDSFNRVLYYSSNWYSSLIDYSFIINGDSVPYAGATPTPSPVPTSAVGDGDATLEYWGDIVATWIFPILLVLVPAVIAAYYLGKIGFIIGLNIGMILGYAALPNIFGLWTVIMLVLVDVAYFFFARDR